MANKVHLKKANRIVTVEEGLANGYLRRGYDQIDKDGKVVKHATGGKTITLAQHNKVLKELEEAKANQGGEEANAQLSEDYSKLEEEHELLKEELEEVKQKAKRFADKGKSLEEENQKLKSQLKNK